MALGIPPLAWFCAATWPVFTPPLTEVAQYVRPKLSSVNFEGKVEIEAVDSRIKTIEMARRMGVPVDGMIQQLAKERGMTLAEAWEAVDNVAIPSLTVE